MANEDLDPEIAALLANSASTSDSGTNTTNITLNDFNIDTGSAPAFETTDTAQDNSFIDSTPKVQTIHDVDLNKKEFPPLEKTLNDTPGDIFNDPKYYNKVLTGENSSAQRVHQLLSKYLTCKDPKDRSVYRQQLITPYWELIRGMASKMGDVNVPLPKKMLLRFGVILPSLFRPEQKDFFSKIFVENKINEPIMYMDEWFMEIISGRMKNSMTDESKPVNPKNLTGEAALKAEQSRLAQLQSKNSGRLQSAENLLNIKENERNAIESELKSKIDNLCTHTPAVGFAPHMEPLNDLQRKNFSEITELLRRLSKNDKELSKEFADYKDAKNSFDSVQQKLNEGGGVPAQLDEGALKVEFETVRQMAKMTVGRQGNQFPIFTREFYHCTERGTGTRENVLEELRWIESIDSGAFCRIHKNIANRIIPYVLLIPTYGDKGFCWEPFDRYNRVTSRARIVVPMYPKDLRIAVLYAVADLRWQVAKEKASYYWMEEGLTGQYYQYTESQKLKGDIKQFFINDYILWMTKESTGIQKLPKEVRGIFWRNMPFPKELKEDLRKRSLVYDDLCKKDANREMSDGY